MRETLLVGGSIAQKPYYGGHTWVILQYALGLKELGWDVVLLDRLDPEMCVDDAGRPCTTDASVNLRYLRDVMAGFGLGDSFALFANGGGQTFGLGRTEVLEKARSCALLLNINGFVDDEDVLAAVPRRVYLDIDPGFPQTWRELGLHDAF
jgi:hypothetical protein